ncbi:MAG TPA: DNA repair protein RecO [Phycisphaerae bacterium]|nr:DNA repair protein RecO [Phycisphaerae bacterium]
MSNYFKDEAICLRVIDFSETSQVVTLFVRAAGLISLLAKGVRKIPVRSRTPLPEPLDLFSRGQVVFIPPRGSSQLGTLSAWQVFDHHPALRRSLKALYSAQITAEVTLLLLKENDPHPELFDQLRCALEVFPGPDSQRMLLAYLKAALRLAGYQPRLDACCVCSKPVSASPALVFIPSLGGVSCQSCTRDGTAIKITPALTLALDRIGSPKELAQTPALRPAKPQALYDAARLLFAYISTLVERKLRTESLLKSIFNSQKDSSAKSELSSVK